MSSIITRGFGTGGQGRHITRGFIAGAAAVAATVAGGWGFRYDYESERRRRDEEERRRQERMQQILEIKDETDREIARMFARQDAEREEQAANERLLEFARRYKAETARRIMGERVAKAYQRAAEQANFSALEALFREMQRAEEEEQFLLMSFLTILQE